MRIFLITAISWAIMAGPFTIHAQEPMVGISGKLVDARTGEPIPFASIQLKSGKTGTATNDNGEFLFKIPATGLSDTLLITCIGYKSVALPLRGAGRRFDIALSPLVIELPPVTVNADAGLNILKTVITKIPENYDTSLVRLMAFYREHITLDTMDLSFNESVLEVIKMFNYDKAMNDQLRIIKGRKKDIHFARDGQLLFWISRISNGARGSLGDDLIKYHNIDVSPFNPKNFRYYHHDYVGTIAEDGGQMIVLEITPRDNSRRALFKLKLFIDEASYAIAKFDLECTEAGVRRVSRKDKGVAYTIMSKVVKATLDYHRFRVSATYKKYNGKWYLNSVRRNFEIFVNSKKRDMVNVPWRANTDFIITDIDTANVKLLDDGNIGNNESSMGSIIKNEPDSAFWEHYNILKPVLPDSLMHEFEEIKHPPRKVIPGKASNRKNGFTRADTLRGTLTPLRTCYDVTFYHLDINVDLDKRSVAGSNLIRFQVQEPFERMQIDLFANMKIDAILYGEDSLTFDREYDAVYVNFPAPLRSGSEEAITVYYHGVPKEPDFSIPMDGGVLWDKDSLGNPWAQVVCQGSGASLWWPNKDHQSDEPDSMKIWITVPSEYEEVSNGRLIRKTPQPGDRTRYEWFVSYPINNYNVTFNIGKYAHYRDFYVTDDTLTIDYHVMAYNLEQSKRLFSQVKPMLKVFERSFGKYPFPRDGFALVESLYPMEHQSGVCIGKVSQQTAGETNPLLWHESAHEWWGNAITSKDIADMWIHEAFATYAEMLMVEELVGKEIASDFMLQQIPQVRNEDPVIGVYDVNHIFYDIGDMYSKGSLMLHTFRNLLDNDSVWFALLRAVQDRFRYQTLSSDELVQFISEYTGTDYQYFFDQYLKHTNLPELQLKVNQNDDDVVVRHRWVADVADFRMPVKVYTSDHESRFIYPTSAWETTVLKGVRASDFYVDEENFYIKVTERE